MSTIAALKQLIPEGIKGLPEPYLSEVADFVVFVRHKVIGEHPYDFEGIRQELHELSKSELQHLEEEFKDFDWQNRFEEIEDIRKHTELLWVDLPPGTDVNDIIDQMNEMDDGVSFDEKVAEITTNLRAAHCLRPLGCDLWFAHGLTPILCSLEIHRRSGHRRRGHASNGGYRQRDAQQAGTARPDPAFCGVSSKQRSTH